MKKRLMAIAATLALASSLLLIPVPSTIADEPVNPVSPSYNEEMCIRDSLTIDRNIMFISRIRMNSD